MATKRFNESPQLSVLVGTEVIPATSIGGGSDTVGNPVAAGTDVKITVLQLLGLKVHEVSVTAGTASIDCGAGLAKNFTLAMTENVTLSVSNLAGAGNVSEFELQIKQDATGGRVLALPASFKALGGSDTNISSAANTVTILSAKTFDNGSTWRYAMQESA